MTAELGSMAEAFQDHLGNLPKNVRGPILSLVPRRTAFDGVRVKEAIRVHVTKGVTVLTRRGDWILSDCDGNLSVHSHEDVCGQYDVAKHWSAVENA